MTCLRRSARPSCVVAAESGQAWVDNDRRLHELLTRLEALGIAAFEADPRWDRQAAKTNVGTRRLTCRQPSSQAPSAQASPKREDLTQCL
jgi:hypothetical protein